MENVSAAVQEIHAVYCAATGFKLRCGIGEYTREAAWARLLQAGFNKDDVFFLIRFLQRKITAGNRYPGCLRFSTLIEDLGKFEEELSMARAESRKPTETPRDKAMRELRPVAPGATTTTVTAKPASEAAQKALEALQREKERIFGTTV